MRELGRVLITGGHGFLGKEVVRQLDEQKLTTELIAPRSTTFDLRRQTAVAAMLYQYAPIDTIIHLAARVSGIGAIAENPGTYFYDNLSMGMNLIESARVHEIKKIVVAGSVCAYPAEAPIPMAEYMLWDGYPEVSNGAYGIAKRVLVTMLQAYWQEYRLNSAYALLTNLYGPYMSFDPKTSHVIPALITKMKKTPDAINVWGNGLATRDFLYVGDAAAALIELAQQDNYTPPLNISSGEEHSIRQLVKMLAEEIGFTGKVTWDTDKPNGQKRRLLDHFETFSVLDWRPVVTLQEGLHRTMQWYDAHQVGMAQ